MAATNRRPHGRRSQAVALVMVLCALFLLSLVIFGLVQRVRDDGFMIGRDSRSLEAKALSFTGLQIALHPMSSLKTSALRRNVDSTHRYAARLLGEGGKLNLNWLLMGEDPRKLEMLKLYLEHRGLNFQEREILVDSMLDWIEPGDTHHLNGTKTGLDGLPVPKRPFQDLAEVRRVNGSEPLIHLPDWDKDFTLLSKGQIDLQWASEDVIATLPGVGEVRARGFVQRRRGEDQLDGTADDLDLASLNNPLAVAQFLGLSEEGYQAISDLVGTDTTVRIVSAGQAYDTVRTLEVVARKEGLQPLILSWKEY